MKLFLQSRIPMLFAALMIAASPAAAQAIYGGLRGIILDPGGAAVANVNVTLRDEATGVTRTTVSNSLGEYSFAQLTPATYTVTAESTASRRLSIREWSSARRNSSIST